MSEKTLNQQGNGGLETAADRAAAERPLINKNEPAPSATSNLNVGSQVTVGPIRKVEGNLKKGDTARASVNQTADNGGPRRKMGQFDDPTSTTSKH